MTSRKEGDEVRETLPTTHYSFLIRWVAQAVSGNGLSTDARGNRTINHARERSLESHIN
jgi:hypothetical protein